MVQIKSVNPNMISTFPLFQSNGSSSISLMKVGEESWGLTSWTLGGVILFAAFHSLSLSFYLNI
jgi:hypothetical protein